MFTFGRPALPSPPALVPRVDPRVELLSIVFRLAGNSEYQMSPLKSYTEDIDAYFAPYKDHPAVLIAKKLASERDVGFDAVMNLAVHLSFPPALKPLVPFTDDIPDARFGRDNALLLARYLSDFCVDTRFERFLSEHQRLFEFAEIQLRSLSRGIDLGWFTAFYGTMPHNKFHLIIGMNNGGENYGPRLVEPDGREQIFAIIGVGRSDGAGNPLLDESCLGEIVHEFSHSFVNPVFAQHKDEFSSAEGVYKRVADQMRKEAYGSSDVMVEESLVRVAVIQILNRLVAAVRKFKAEFTGNRRRVSYGSMSSTPFFANTAPSETVTTPSSSLCRQSLSSTEASRLTLLR
jgi:hypothetical protein